MALTVTLEATALTTLASGQLGTMGWLMGPPPPPPHTFSALMLLRGAGVPVAKSVLLLWVSVQPLAARSNAVMAVLVGPTLPSKKLASPKPTRSTIWLSWVASQGLAALPLHVSPVATVATMTLPLVPERLMPPVASGVGRSAPAALPASLTR